MRVHLQNRDGRLTMTVSDEGIGMAPGEHRKPDSFGLAGIEQRMHLPGASCTLTSALGKETGIMVPVPLIDAPAPATQAWPAVADAHPLPS